jgi:hypothetical protein
VEAIDGAISVYRLVLEDEPEAWLSGYQAAPNVRADLSEADSDICRSRASRTPALEGAIVGRIRVATARAAASLSGQAVVRKGA